MTRELRLFYTCRVDARVSGWKTGVKTRFCQGVSRGGKIWVLGACEMAWKRGVRALGRRPRAGL